MKPERKSNDDWMLLSEETTAPPSKKKKKPKPAPVYVEIDYPARLAMASFAWALVGWLIAAAAPHLAFLPLIGIVNYLLPTVTVGLIGANLHFAVRDLWRGAHPLRLLVVTGLQVGLFTTLFFQIYAHVGAEFYDVDGPTSAWQWVMFSFGHALRASDVVDFIEAYSLRVQPIKHHGWLVAIFVILYHIVIDVFVLAILWKAVDRIKRRLMKDENVRFFVRWIAIVVLSVWFIAWIVVAFVIYPWSLVDVPLWFLENVLRVLDFADIMESFDIQLHSLPRQGINGTLTFVCRIFIGVGIAYVLGRKKKSADNRVMTPPDEDPLPYWSKRAGMVFAILIGICIFGTLAQLIMGDPATRLAEAVGGDSQQRTQSALAGLRRMGPAAKATIPTLLAARERSAPPVPEEITRVLGYFGTAAIPSLTTIAQGNDESSAVVAIRGLARIGADSAGGIAETWSVTGFELVRQAADRELRAMGSEAVPAIMEITTLANAERHYQWFQELDRNWRLRSSSNKVATALQSLPDHLRRLEMGFNAATFAEICAGLRDCGTAARKTAPKMLDALADKDASIVSSAESVLVAIGPEVTPELLRRADDPKLKTYDAQQQKLDEPFIRLLSRREMWDSKVLKDPLALPMVTKILARKDTTAGTRSTFLDVLKTSGPAAKDAIPMLVVMFGEADAEERAKVRQTLVSIDPNWQKHPHTGRAIPPLLPRLGQLLAPPLLKKGEKAVPETAKEAKDTAAEIVAALGNLDAADSQAVIDALLGDGRLSDQKLAQQRAGLFKAVELLGPKLKAAAPAMAKFVMDPKSDLRHKYYMLDYMKPIGADFETIGPAALAYLKESHESLKLIQNFGSGAVAHVGSMLDDKNPNPKYFAVWAAEKLEATAKPLVPKLIELLREPDVVYQIALRDSLQSESLSTRQRVLRALQSIDKEWTKHPASVKALAAAIRSVAQEPEDAQKRLYAFLGQMGPAARPLIPDIARLLVAPKSAFNEETAKALDKIDERWRDHEAIKAMIPDLCRLFAKGDISYEKALTLLGPTVTTELEKALEGASAEVRFLALRLLTNSAMGKDAIPALVRQLSSPHLHLVGTEELLKKINAADPQWTANPKLKDIIPKVLDEVAKGEWKEHRYKLICKALGDKALPYSLAKLASDKADDRQFALLGLAEIGPAAKSSIPAVQKVMNDKNSDVRQYAINALLSIGPDNKALVQPIGLMLLDRDSHVLSTAQSALDRIDPNWRKSKAIKPAHQGLLKNLQHKDPVVRIMALVSIETCGRFDGVEPALERVLKTDQDAGARRRAEHLLKHFKEKK